MMALNVQQLVAALPPELDEVSDGPVAFRNALREVSHHLPPTGALARLWSLGSLQGRIALAYIAYWIRSGYAPTDERVRLLNEAHLKSALKAVAGMSYLRGIVMKVGQTLANYPNVVPAEFAKALGALNFEAPPMHYALVAEQFRRELNAEPQVVFASFDRTAFAAASLGQVHRARLRTGELVAVKIQYPGIARTIASDIRNLLTFMTPMRLSGQWHSLREMLANARDMMELETDYVREADLMRRARAVFKPDESIVVPRVFDHLSTRRVITMEYLDGVHIDEYLRSRPSQEERDRYGELIMRASFRLAHTARIWYADSNPGNYMFLHDGRLGVIDFGCCCEFTPIEWDYYMEIYRAQRIGGDVLRHALIRAAGLDPSKPQDPEHVDLLMKFSDWYSGYLQFDGKWNFGDEQFIQRGVDLMSEAFRKRLLFALPVNTWITRQLIGLRALAFRLNARINMKKLDREESGSLPDLHFQGA